MEASERERGKFLELALTNYGKTLARSEEGRHDVIVFRFISLWFDNADSDSVNGLVQGLVANIPSHKFVGLLYQLAARMSDQVGHGKVERGRLQLLFFFFHFQTPSFWRVLSKLISRTVQEHPFHALPVLLALANANADEDAANGTLDLGTVHFAV